MPQQTTTSRILVIDDDEMSRELLVALLEAGGYTVSSAESGEAALALLQSSPRPDVILTDMQMPGSVPAQLAGRLRRACGRTTLLVAMSGSHPSADTVARYDVFLLKPFSVAQFISAVESARAAHVPAAKKLAAVREFTQPTGMARAQKKTSAIVDLAASAASASKRSMESASQPARSDTIPILDESVYRQLAGSMPAPQLHEMYSMCLTDARARIADMRTLAAAHDSAQLSRQAHAIKGSAGMLGASEMHRIAAALEEDGLHPTGSAANSPAVAVNSLDELSAACDRLERMLGSRA